MGGSLARDLAVGALAGHLGSQAMDRATTWYWNRMSETAKAREHDANPDGTPLVVGRRVAAALGRDATDETAARVAAHAHRALGVTYGVKSALLTRWGMPPMAAGVLNAAAAFVVVDELAMSVLLPAPDAYPVESHVRGAVGHLTLGVTVGLVLTAAERLRR
jgi:hypothetical protein